MREWMLVSPQRTDRPWQGQTEAAAAPAAAPAHDPHCYLCPGNARAHGARNPDYGGVYIFDNDFPAMNLEAAPAPPAAMPPLLRWAPEPGVCRVVCYSPRHDLTLSHLPQAAVEAVVAAWTEQAQELGGRPEIASVMIFENRGAMMGASNPHPHGQIWANAHLPNLIAREQAALGDYHHERGGCLLCDYLQMELEQRERVVWENEGFVAVVPYWANWPFEVLLLSRAHRGGLEELAGGERGQLAAMLRRLLRGYDGLFATPFPNSWGFHLPPTDGQEHPENHLHAHFYPPLLRSATVRKFMVGYELLAMPQRDLTPESAAARLREATLAATLAAGAELE
ncbi:MAG TPA: UDP-glucose--hexose-1-phosphate uridylyltransferase [Terriglobales bacterium]|nr:UDP-glucose--hexose-1-phosphate uridylyltransferase [Terriglobales bacterium]